MSKQSASNRRNAFPVNRIAQAARVLSMLAGMASPGLVMAQQLSFSQTPPLSASSQGALPNVIVGIDATPSMNLPLWNDAACSPGTRIYTVGGKTYTASCPDDGKQERIYALREAVLVAFGSPSLLGKFRLAYESSYWDYGFGPNRFFKNPKGYDNSMKLFDATEQAQFIDWIQNLPAVLCSATPGLVSNAGEYLRGNWLAANNSYYGPNAQTNYMTQVQPGDSLFNWGIDNSAGYPVAALSNWALTCGYNSYHNSDYNKKPTINPSTYLQYTPMSDTDRSVYSPWNSTQSLGTATTSPTKDTSTPLSCRRSYFIYLSDGGSNGPLYSVSLLSKDSADDNYNNKSHKLPDGNTYDPTAAYATIYKDTTRYGNLASQAFYYWANDLSGKGAGVVDTSSTMPISNAAPYSATVGGVTFSKTYQPYWNPQNDPATWQHMQTYAIGFGTAPTGAGQIPASTSTTPNANGTNSSSCKIAKLWANFSGIKSPNSYWTYQTGGTDPCAVNNLPDGWIFPGFDSQFGNFFSGYASGAYTWPYTVGYNDSIMAANMNYYIPTDPTNTSGAVEFVLDIVHATYNGRGKFFPATSVSALSDAFSSILNSAITQSASSGTASASASSSRLTSGTLAYAAGYAYDTSKAVYDATNRRWGNASTGAITGTINGWSGSLTAIKMSTDGSGQVTGVNGGTAWSATIPAARNVFTANASGTGIAFAWSGLSGDALATSAGLTQIDVNAALYNPLGDIVNSQLVYVGQPLRLSLDSTYPTFLTTVNGFNGSKKYRNGMLYAGANDGMLHGFDAGQGTAAAAGTGQEKMAYVPRGLLGALHTKTFADSGYTHRYWDDGSLFSGEAQLSAPGAGTTAADNPGNWGTVLAGTLGAGGPGYFVLDVTNPALFTAASANKLVLIDATDTSSASPIGSAVLPYIGYQFSPPVMEMYTSNQPAQIVQINTNQTVTLGSSPAPKLVEWAVIMGNGYNSASGLPVLLVQSLTQKNASGRLLLYTVPAVCTVADINNCKKAGNGLSAPRPIDVDGNGTADIVYAGDLMGNLWKFDISNPDHSKWKVANSSGNQSAPLFSAVGPTGQPQPITTAPVVVPNHEKGGFMVVFGTGKNLTDADRTDTNLNSVYGLYDNEPVKSDLATLTVTGPGKVTVGQVLLGDSQLDNTKPAPSPIPATCSGTGANRYSPCLYPHSDGAMSNGAKQTTGGVTVTVNQSSTTQNEIIDDQKAWGWYYDIPDIANSNAAKVLANPLVMSGNTLVFYSQNVISSTGSGGSVTESCNPVAVVSGAITTINFFDLLTGNPTNNILTSNGTAYNLDGKNLANRFQYDGVTNFIPKGADSMACLGANCTQSLSLAKPPPGAHAGWRIAQ